MKIKDMTTKTSLEVQDSDLLVIEDKEDTKSITVAEFKQALKLAFSGDIDRAIKVTINDAIDNIVASLQKCKYNFAKVKKYLLSIWIDNDSGEINIGFLDEETNEWLTAESIAEMMQPDEDGVATLEFVIKAEIAEVFKEATGHVVLDFNTTYPSSAEVNSWMAEDNAGFIRAYFTDLTQNEIAGILHDDIQVILPDTEETEYVFVTDEDAFSNAVAYTETIPEGEEPSSAPTE